jgi:hypothetical protein
MYDLSSIKPPGFLEGVFGEKLFWFLGISFK